MIFKKADFISPSITFYHKGYLSHPSILSGILSIISFILILSIAIYFSLDIIQRQNPTVFYFKRFIEDAGTFPFNSSSFFHFLSLKVNGEFRNGGMDFKSFRVIGIETYFQVYSSDRNLTKLNHWLYGYCNNETDTIGISNLIKYDFFQKSACIRKYYNAEEQKYYDVGDPKFRWPAIAKGTFHSDSIQQFYSIIVERCEEETLNLILGENNICKSDDEVKEVIGFNSASHLFFIDNYVDVSNYKSPNTKFFYRIENALQIGSYPINH